ncbi:hypothetical protein UT300005_03600 [Clostridium sp. CTA-5]
MIKKSILKILAKYIISNFNDDKKEVIDYILDHATEISKVCTIENDLIEKELINRNSASYDNLIKIIEQKLDNNKIKRSICIENVYPLFFIKTNGNKLKSLEETYTRMLECVLEKEDKNKKGYFYQELVLKFLDDLGIECISIKKSCDGGIDIIGVEEINIFNSKKSRKMCIHGQVKCYSEQVKPFELKQLIKDDIYMSIESNEMIKMKCKQLLFVSHNGFTEKAEEYGNEHNIVLLDSQDLINMSIDNIKISKGLKYIEKMYKMDNDEFVEIKEE